MGTTSQKLTYLNETKTLIRNGINAIGGEITAQDTFRSYVDALNDIYDYLPKVSSSGTTLTLNNATNGRINIELSPSEMEQETTTGANIQTFTPIEITTYVNYKCDEKGQVTITSTSQYTELAYNSRNPMTLSAGTYKIKVIGKYKNIKFRYSMSSTSRYNYLKLDANNEATIILKEDTNKFYIYQEFRDSTCDCDYYITLASGTTATTERYTGSIPAPNPSYPQEVHTITGDNTILVRGSQLFDGIFELGAISSANGQNISNNNYIRCKNYIPVEELTNYKFSTDDSFITTVSVYEYKEDFSYNLTARKGVSLTNYLTTNKDTKYIRFDVFTHTSIKFMLNKGTTALPYTPYVSQEAQLNLGDIEYCKIGNYEDEFVRSRNLFDSSQLLNATGWNKNSDGYYNGNLNNYYNAFRNGFTFANPFKENTQYTLKLKAYTTGGTPRFRFEYTDGSAYELYLTATSPTEYTYTTTSGKTLSKIIGEYGTGGSQTLYLANIMLNEGTTALELDKWYLQKNIGKVVLDGSENWNKNTAVVATNAYINNDLFPNRLSSGGTLCNYLTNVSSASGTGIFSGGSLNFCFESSDFDTVEKFTNWLGTHNTIVYYQLATPEYILLNDTLQSQLEYIYNQMLAYKGQTNISQINNDLPFVINVSALLDLNTLVGE